MLQGSPRTHRIRSALIGATLEDALHDRHGRKGVGPSGVKGEVRDYLRGLRPGETVIQCPVEVAGKLRELARGILLKKRWHADAAFSASDLQRIDITLVTPPWMIAQGTESAFLPPFFEKFRGKTWSDRRDNMLAI